MAADRRYTIALGDDADGRTFGSIDDVCDALITDVPPGSRFVVYRTGPGKPSRVLLVEATMSRQTPEEDPDELAC